MAEREKVIWGLECCTISDPDDHRDCKKCPYRREGITNEPCFNGMMIQALALLKEQEPRVIKEGELSRFQRKDVWIEKILSNYQHIVYAATLEVVSGYCIFHGMEYDERINDYNVECAYGWRCWTSRPSEQRIRDTKWEDN